MTHAGTESSWPDEVRTLAIDIGGSGIKAAVLDSQGSLLVDRVRVDTPYPCPPERLVATLVSLADDLPNAHRASIGFPGLVRDGRVLTIPSLSRATYDGPHDPDLAAQWERFDLASALEEVVDIPTLIVNDADMQGCAVISGEGMEFVITLGTGIGTGLFHHGTLLPHLELSHGPFLDGKDVDRALGNVERKRIGRKRWRKRVSEAIEAFDAVIHFDRIYIGGGNAKHLEIDDIGPKGEIVSNAAGVIGGVRLWDMVEATAQRRG